MLSQSINTEINIISYRITQSTLSIGVQEMKFTGVDTVHYGVLAIEGLQ